MAQQTHRRIALALVTIAVASGLLPATAQGSEPCSCSQPIEVSNTVLAWTTAGQQTTFGQNCTTCNGPSKGAWFQINKLSIARLILLDVCSPNGNQPSMLLDVYTPRNSSSEDACDSSQLARVASFRTAFGDSTGCRVRFMAQPNTMYFVNGWVDPDTPVAVPISCGPALVNVARQPIKAQSPSCLRPIDINMDTWKPTNESQDAPMFSFGEGTTTCNRGEGVSTWRGLRGQRDVTYRFFNAQENMTVTVMVEPDTGYNQGNSPYSTPTLTAFTWRSGICNATRDALSEEVTGTQLPQYLNQQDNGVSTVLEFEMWPGRVVNVVASSIGGSDELCGLAKLNVWAEYSSHIFMMKGTPYD